MARPVYSAQFIVYTPETPNTSFEVPAGYTAVVRDAQCTQNIGGFQWNLYFQNSEAAPACFFQVLTDVGVYETATFRGRIVVPAGGIITSQLSSVGSGCWVYVGGYLLTD